MFVGLVRARDAEPPPEPRRREPPQVPWRALLAVAAWCALVVLADELGHLAGYLVLVFAVAVGSWRLERWCEGQHWGGLKDHRS